MNSSAYQEFNVTIKLVDVSIEHSSVNVRISIENLKEENKHVVTENDNFEKRYKLTLMEHL